MKFELPLECLFNNQKRILDVSSNIDVYELSSQILTDLEIDIDLSHTPYNHIFSQNNNTDDAKDLTLSKSSKLRWDKYYSSNPYLIKTIQSIILTNAERNSSYIDNNEKIYEIMKVWKDFDCGDKLSSFCNKYGLIEWKRLQKFNQYPLVLQGLSMYNLFSPAFQLILPIIILIIPFFLIKFILRLPITISVYKKILYSQLQKHSIGKIFTLFDPNVTYQTKATALVVLLLYGVSIYQNVLTCMKFYSNTNFICRFLNMLRETTETTIEYHNNFIKTIDTIDEISLNEFTKDVDISNIKYVTDEYNKHKSSTIKYITFYKQRLRENNDKLQIFHDMLLENTYDKLTPKKIWNVGNNLKKLYNLYTQEDLKEIITYIDSFRKFNIDCIFLSKSLSKPTINKCNFNISKLNTIKFKQCYYPFLLNNVNNNIVENDYNKKHNEKARLITGPNASGKTTYIKSVMINLIFSQQLGLGFYSNALITPQHQFYCYLTIPDTSGRDSLFQAEARRCLDIINDVECNKELRHFAIFDEIFSGTNTIEAVNTAYKYIQYMSNYNFTSLITTHFTTLVKKLLNKKVNKNNNNCSYKMNVERNDDSNSNKIHFRYLYTTSKGINNIQGAVKVLQDLNFPIEFYS